MLYPVYVHVGNEKEAHGVLFPDFAGCHSAADTWEGLPAAIQEAAEAHFHGETDPVPSPTPLEQLTQNPDYQGGVWMLADIDLKRSQATRKQPPTEAVFSCAQRKTRHRAGLNPAVTQARSGR